MSGNTGQISSTVTTVPDGWAGVILKMAPGRLHPQPVRVQPDVPLAQADLQHAVDQPRAVVGDNQASHPVAQAERHTDLARGRVLDHIGQQLACRTEQQRVERAADGVRPGVDVDLDGEPTAVPSRARQFLNRARQAGVFEYRGMQVGDR